MVGAVSNKTDVSQIRFTQPGESPSNNVSQAPQNDQFTQTKEIASNTNYSAPFQSNTATGASSVTNKTVGPAGPSPFSPYVEGLADKYAAQFNLNTEQMKGFLLAVLDNEAGGDKRFLPPNGDINAKYHETGDRGHGHHAWQLDDGSWPQAAAPMSFIESGDFAISKVLLPAYKNAVEKGVSDPRISAARQYNAGSKGLTNDAATTQKYGARTLAAWQKFSGNNVPA
jgi:hypothetical protein